MEIIKDKFSTAPVDERVAALEKKMKEIEALVKGLTEELLDLKSIAMKLNKVNEERRAELRMTKPSVQSGPVTIQKKPPITMTSQRTPKPQPEPEKLDLIMQTDGTLKPEKRKSDEYIVASAGYTKKGKRGTQGAGKRGDLIVAEDDESESGDKK